MAKYSTPVWENDAAPAIDSDALTNMGQAVELAQHPYGECSTGTGVAVKAVSIDFPGTLTLFAGMTIRVKFLNGNTAADPTLNVNSTGAVAIKAYGTISGGIVPAGQILTLVYDGTNWLYGGVDAYNKEQSLSSGTAANIATLTGATPATPDSALNLLASLGSARVATGEYTGNGRYGTLANGCTITLSFAPKFVVVAPLGSGLSLGQINGTPYFFNSLVWIDGQSSGTVTGDLIYFSQSGTTLQWYSTVKAASQLNTDGVTYKYIAIG